MSKERPEGGDSELRRDLATMSYELREGVAIVTLNRPEARNALDVPMRQELADLIAEIRDDDRVKAVILTGAGGVFCAGGDLRGLKEKRTSAQSYKRIADLHVWLPSLVNLEKPVIAAVDGPAFGGGMNLALAADFVLASDNARFCQVFGRIGLVPDLAGMSLLPRLVGLQRAKELVFSGRTLRPDEAKEMGIVHSVHAPDQLQDAAFALARRFCNASTLAIGLAKNILNQSFNLDQRAMAELEAMAQALCMDSTYHKEAVQRFLDKEPALFDWDSMDKKEAAT
ncbi:enoyl-CoA hydratase/isomerase family protein [Pseudooceanicola batsensis]|uniref:enoyl-CoA hydratase/isomerase family protein n=1 Tax=Pseudooceanicola batsensis TaxID=314255 RepID=UPI00032280D5|nr:enoyl-CoA hydratase/isomerase family protein [Pseudooceanicola batsensis]